MRVIFNKGRSKDKLRNRNTEYDVNLALNILKRNANSRVERTRKIPATVVDDFLFSGNFNSVLGLEGFNKFKSKLRDITKSINKNDFSENLINLDKMFEVLLDSGLYYNEDSLPDSFKNANSDPRWLTAYRYIAKNFPDIDYTSFRTIVKRFQETKGHSFYIEMNDSTYLIKIPENKKLFIEIEDVKSDLLQLNQSELKNICNQVGVQPARKNAETVERLLLNDPKRMEQFIPHKNRERTNLIIKDEELATGDDLINLDKYLRELARLIRSDFADYILSKRYISFIQE